MNKTELLAPVGNIETFYAAMEGGADAIYLGMKQFNARERALNFSENQLAVIVQEAHKKNRKVYITLNTVIKNNEISKLIDVLSYLTTIQPDAVIIQDWGVYFIIKKYFNELTIHASTQMANHNSTGAEFSQRKDFERLVLARELTISEVKEVKQKTDIELEVFIHGALCYSFSGMCHISSYLGGHGANRGRCTQVCRREFCSTSKPANTKSKIASNKYLFSLKDNQQIDAIGELVNIGVDSLKIEGRLKSSDYVYRVSRAYRMAIDDDKNKHEAAELLEFDMGRDKTSYFLGGNVKNAITQNPNTGLFLGTINKITEDGFEFYSDIEFDTNLRIRIKHPKKDEQQNLKLRNYTQNGKKISVIAEGNFVKNSKVYLSSIQDKKFSSKLPKLSYKLNYGVGKGLKSKIFKQLVVENNDKKARHKLFVRIDTLKWLRKIYFDNVDSLIFSFTQKDFEDLKLDSNLIQRNKHKIWIEFPKYIPENKIKFYEDFSQKLAKNGLKQFVLSHLSQKLMLPKNVKFITNENVYAYNDAAIKLLKNEGANNFSYPIENDKENIDLYKNKQGIMPVYFYPQLFISRMPIEAAKDETFKDDTNTEYKKHVRDGITFTVPSVPVSFLQYVKDFKSQGFKNFLIDLSFEKPSSNRINTLLNRYKQSKQIQPSVNFNFKRELK